MATKKAPDIVYFVKDNAKNEELKYSLRSLENFEHGKVWFFGSCPKGLEPDEFVYVPQRDQHKWDNTKRSLIAACNNKKLSANFYLFNDDFFIMKPWEYETVYNGDLYKLIVHNEDKIQKFSRYTTRLRELAGLLDAQGYEVKNYCVHMPLLVNKKQALKTIELFPECSMFRSLYGNVNDIGGVNKPDCKIVNLSKVPDADAILLSTSDKSFKDGKVGEFIRSKFKEPSRYEK